MAEQPFVLVVDDEPDFREIFSVKLSAAGYKVDTAENGAVALQKMASAKPDLVLMDVKMPVMDGPTTMLKMKDDPALKDIKVAFLTNFGDPHRDLRGVDKKFAEEFGARGYLKKTDDLAMLVDRVKALLQ